MGFIVRMVFWFSLVLLALPFGPQGGSGGLSPFQALLAARDAMSDLTGMCDRKPDVCRTGKDALETIGVRAREGARIAVGMLGEEDGPTDRDATVESAVEAK